MQTALDCPACGYTTTAAYDSNAGYWRCEGCSALLRRGAYSTFTVVAPADRAAFNAPARPAHSGSRRLEVLREQAPHLIAAPAPEPKLTPAELAQAVVDGLAPQVSLDTLLELHGALVVLPTANPIIDALLTELEAAFMGRRRPVAS